MKKTQRNDPRSHLLVAARAATSSLRRIIPSTTHAPTVGTRHARAARAITPEVCKPPSLFRCPQSIIYFQALATARTQTSGVLIVKCLRDGIMPMAILAKCTRAIVILILTRMNSMTMNSKLNPGSAATAVRWRGC